MSEPPLRILMVTPHSPLQSGGVQRYVWEVSTRLVARGVHVEVLHVDPDANGARRQERDGVVIRSVPAWLARGDLLLAPKLWSEMNVAWDVIHVQSYHTLVAPLAMLRARSLQVPYCVTFHAGGHSSRLRHRARALQRRLLRPLLRDATALVALAAFEIELYSRSLAVPRERFRLIPVGTDLKVREDTLDPGAEEPSLLASLGRLERYKGHQRVIAALPHLLERRPEARLLIVGTGPYEEKLREFVRRHGVEDRVELTSVPAGDTAGMAALLSRVSLVVLMSEYETFPQVALEAAAARRRLLVADDRAGLRELAGEGLAQTVPLRSSPRELAAAIDKELEKPAPSARPRLSSWDECVQSLLTLYREIARR